MTDLEQQLRSYFEAIEPQAGTDLPTPVIDVTDTKEPTMNPRTWLLAAAAALLLLVGGVVIVRSGDDNVVETVDTPTTTESTTTTEPPADDQEAGSGDGSESPPGTELTAASLRAAAEEAMDAVLSLDPARIEALALPNGVAEGLVRLQLEFEAVNAAFRRSPCEVTSPTTASCPYSYTDDLIEAVGAEEAFDNTATIVASADTGDVVRISMFSVSFPPGFDAALNATRETHPEFWEGECRVWPDVPDPAPAPGACELQLIEIFSGS